MKLQATAAFIAAALLSVSAQAADIAAGKVAYEKDRGANTCVTCHGANGATTQQPQYPKLAGQHPDYLIFALRSYQRGAAGQTTGLVRKNAIMAGPASTLTDKEIKNIAAYLNSLGSELELRK